MRELGEAVQVHETVSKIHPGDRADRIADIVFVHGLNDNSKNCWTNPQTHFNFPAGLANDFPNMGVWTFDYDAAPLALFGGNALPLQQRATNTLAQLAAQGIGDRPVIFIVHSMGGLVMKWTLRVAKDVTTPRWKKILEQTRGMIFFSTPHSGSDIANWLTVLLSILPGTVALDNLRAHDPSLNDLNTWYRENAPGLGIRTLVYYEEKNTSGLQSAPGIGRFFGKKAGRAITVRVVDRDSANPGLTGVVPIGVNADHFEVCKVPGTDDFRYIGVKEFIEECQAKTESWTPTEEKKSLPNPTQMVKGELVLPNYNSSFIGRKDEILSVLGLVQHRRLTTLLGAGGIGKTRLAIEVARTSQHDFSDGIKYFNLSSISEAEHVYESLCESLGAETRIGRPIDNILRCAAGKNWLIILDGCERYLQQCRIIIEAFLSENLYASIKFLVTSQIPISITGEQIYSVNGLKFPNIFDISVGKAHEWDSIALFEDRRQLRYSDFR